MDLKKWLTLLTFATFAVGCQKMSPAQRALDSVNGGQIDKAGDRPACEINPAEYVLDSTLVAFDMTDSFGVHAGFDLIGKFLKLLSIDLKATSGRMRMAMSLKDPLSPSVELLPVTGDGVSFDFGAAIDIGYQNIGAGFDFSHKTPLATLAERSLNETFTALTTQMKQLQEPWRTQVVAIPTSDIVIIPMGSYANIKKGDTFAIYNVDHQWKGKACESVHMMALKNPAVRVAVARADQVENNASALTLLDTTEDPRMREVKIKQGAQVEIVKLTEPDRELFRLMQIRDVIGAQISYVDNKKVDVTQPLKDQIRAIAHDYGFMNYTP